ADRGWREEGAREELVLSQVLDCTDLHGWLGLEHGQVVDEALRAATGVPAADDERTPAQRRAGALVHVCRTYLDGGVAQQGARVRPHLAITVDAVTLAALVAASRPGAGAEMDAFGSLAGAGAGAASPDLSGNEPPARACSGPAVVIPGVRDVDQLRGVHPASLANGTPIPHEQLAKLLCDGELHRVVFGPDGQILDSGRSQRLFTAAQSRAIIARDRHCQYPGCSAPPWEGEIHHSIWWYHQGRTSTDNGVLLCWHHHTYVHQQHLTISQRVTRAGPQELRHWVFTRPDGEQIGAPPPPVPPPRE